MTGFRLGRAHGSVEAAVSAAKPSTRHACHFYRGGVAGNCRAFLWNADLL